jgi:hypothetical protein
MLHIPQDDPFCAGDMSMKMSRQELGNNAHVIIQKNDHLSFGRGDASISGFGSTLSAIMLDDSQLEIKMSSVEIRTGRIGRAVIDDQDLITVRRIRQAL